MSLWSVSKYSVKNKNITEAATRGVLQNKVFLKISQILQKTPMLESLFNKIAGLQVKMFKDTYFEEEHLLKAASSVL